MLHSYNLEKTKSKVDNPEYTPLNKWDKFGHDHNLSGKELHALDATSAVDFRVFQVVFTLSIT